MPRTALIPVMLMPMAMQTAFFTICLLHRDVDWKIRLHRVSPTGANAILWRLVVSYRWINWRYCPRLLSHKPHEYACWCPVWSYMDSTLSSRLPRKVVCCFLQAVAHILLWVAWNINVRPIKAGFHRFIAVSVSDIECLYWGESYLLYPNSLSSSASGPVAHRFFEQRVDIGHFVDVQFLHHLPYFELLWCSFCIVKPPNFVLLYTCLVCIIFETDFYGTLILSLYIYDTLL